MGRIGGSLERLKHKPRSLPAAGKGRQTSAERDSSSNLNELGSRFFFKAPRVASPADFGLETLSSQRSEPGHGPRDSETINGA